MFQPHTGTIAVLMLLANLYLLCWDYERLRPALFPRAAALALHHPGDLERSRLGARRFVWVAAIGVALLGLGATVLTVTGPLQSFHAPLTLLFAGFSVPVVAFGLWSIRHA